MRDKKSSEIADLINDETFDMDTEEIRQLGYHSVDLMVDYFKNISKGPILTSNTFEQIKELIIEPLPKEEKNPISVINECKEKIMDNSIRLGHPRFLGWIVTSGTIIGAFADGIASAINQNVAISRVAMATSIELLVIEWIKEIIDYDSNAAGILLSGGSMANFTAPITGFFFDRINLTFGLNLFISFFTMFKNKSDLNILPTKTKVNFFF